MQRMVVVLGRECQCVVCGYYILGSVYIHSVTLEQIHTGTHVSMLANYHYCGENICHFQAAVLIQLNNN